MGEDEGSRGRLLWWGGLVVGVTVVCALLHARIFQGFAEQSFDTAVSVQGHYLALHGGGASGITGLSWLGDHVAPLLFLELPVFAVWPGALSLQILKCFALALALPGTWLLVRVLAGAPAATGAVILVLAGPLFWTAALADHHTETLGAALLPWLLLAYERRRIGWFCALAVAVALGKENLPLVVGGVAVLALFDRRRPGWWLGTGVAAGAWFLLAVGWIQPHAAGGAAPKAFLYRHLASVDGWRAILSDPRLWGWLTTLGLLGGALALLAPSGLWPAVPLLLQNGLSSNPASRMLDFHYVAPLLFTLVYAAARGVRRLGPRPRRLVFCVLLAVQLGGSWFLGPWGRVLDVQPSAADDALVAAVPRGAPAWASVSTAAQLAARERLYLVEALTTGRFAGNDRSFDLDRVARAGWPRHGLIDVRDRDVLVMPPGLEAVDAVGDRVRLAAVVAPLGAPLVALLDDPSSLGPATGRVAGLVFHAGREGRYAVEVGSPVPNLLHLTLVREGGVEVDRQVHRPLYGFARKPGVYRTRYHPPALESAPPGRYRVVATFPGRPESAVVTTFDRGSP